MYSVNATTLKNRLGEVLARARLGPVAILRHGKVVAHLNGVREAANGQGSRSHYAAQGLSRSQEERLAVLCSRGDLRPSRWQRAGDRRMLAGVATMLASQPEFDRLRLLSLAETLSPGMTQPASFARWLEHAPVKAARLLPLVRAEMRRQAR